MRGETVGPRAAVGLRTGWRRLIRAFKLEALGLWALCLYGCSSPVDEPLAEIPPDTLRIAVVEAPGAAFLAERLTALSLKGPARLVLRGLQAPSPETLRAWLMDGRADAAYGDALFALSVLATAPEAEILAVAIFDSGDTFRSYLAVAATSPWRRMADLEGASLRTARPESIEGVYFPMACARRLGYHPRAFFGGGADGGPGWIFTGSDSLSLAALDADSLAVAAVASSALSEGNPRRLRIIAKSNPIPQPALVASPQLSPALRLRLRDALLATPLPPHSSGPRGFSRPLMDDYADLATWLMPLWKP